MDAPYLIAITGGSGSGKTTLARVLTSRLGAERALLLGEDNYYRPRIDYGPEAPGWTAAQMEQKINFDDPASKDMALFETHLRDLQAGRSIEQPIYDFATHDRVDGETRKLPPKPVIIVEGVHVLSDQALFDLFDLTVFVDTPDDLRLARRIARDVAERGRALDRVLAQYLNFVRAAHHRFTEPAKFRCDIVVKDEGPLASAVGVPGPAAEARLAAAVWARLLADGIVSP
ncbi:MAG: uridine kinase [Pseudomonadota bacterium]